LAFEWRFRSLEFTITIVISKTTPNDINVTVIKDLYSTTPEKLITGVQQVGSVAQSNTCIYPMYLPLISDGHF